MPSDLFIYYPESVFSWFSSYLFPDVSLFVPYPLPFAIGHSLREKRKKGGSNNGKETKIKAKTIRRGEGQSFKQ